MRACLGLIILLCALTGCQPLPHPFEDDKLRPDAPILTMPDAVGIVVEPLRGVAEPTASGVAEAMAAALRDLDIPASTKEGNRQSFHLTGDAAATKPGAVLTEMTIQWRLTDAAGKELTNQAQQAQLASADWIAGQGPALAPLLKTEAIQIASLIQEAPQAEHKPERQVFVRTVDGAPGDGNRALPKALIYLLKNNSVDITPDAQAVDTIIVAGYVSVTPASTDQDHVSIVWRVLRPDGSSAGEIKQENNVPRGSLSGSWSDISMAVAGAAVDQIIRVINTVPAAR